MQVELSSLARLKAEPARNALAQLLVDIPALVRGREQRVDPSKVDGHHVRLEEPAFGIAPGHGELWATLRTPTDVMMERAHLEAEI
jgi:hypothetical protein